MTVDTRGETTIPQQTKIKEFGEAPFCQHTLYMNNYRIPVFLKLEISVESRNLYKGIPHSFSTTEDSIARDVIFIFKCVI